MTSDSDDYYNNIDFQTSTDMSYLRHGVFPIIYDLEPGHCHLRYYQLLEEARYL